jgi:putative transposase
MYYDAMPRANRQNIPGHVWHITHRCHAGDFLFKFGMDRGRYLHWLFEAKKRFGLCVLHYAVTSNHVHLILVDTGGHVIPRSIQLAAGRMGQEYNERRERSGAFWGDRYHATAVQTGEHLVRCMIYLDFNMVRAGAVVHPEDWPHCGYNEIIYPPKRYTLIDRNMLSALLYMKGEHELSGFYRSWIDDAMGGPPSGREPAWTESLAVGSQGFVENIKGELSSRAIGRKIGAISDDMFSLREPRAPYGGISDIENAPLSIENTHFWDVSY